MTSKHPPSSDEAASDMPPRRIVIFGNSGSGKSTLALAWARDFGLPHLDLDEIAWAEPGQRRELPERMPELRVFIDTHESWVVEGCYGSLIAGAATRASELVFLNRGIEVCQANCRSRPWEPPKYDSPEAQDQNLAKPLDWVAAYESRTDEFSLQAHRRLFDAFTGRKREVTDLAQAFNPASRPGR